MGLERTTTKFLSSEHKSRRKIREIRKFFFRLQGFREEWNSLSVMNSEIDAQHGKSSEKQRKLISLFVSNILLTLMTAVVIHLLKKPSNSTWFHWLRGVSAGRSNVKSSNDDTEKHRWEDKHNLNSWSSFERSENFESLCPQVTKTNRKSLRKNFPRKFDSPAKRSMLTYLLRSATDMRHKYSIFMLRQVPCACFPFELNELFIGTRFVAVKRKIASLHDSLA